ncbi:MAG: hypothetical protein LBB51_01915 [Zoogloeaceae bacterium]|nr:hypothetical protein [Zoogloeaceae bacterium]
MKEKNNRLFHQKRWPRSGTIESGEISSVRKTKHRINFFHLVIARAVRPVAIQCARKGASRPLEKPRAFGPRNDEV